MDKRHLQMRIKERIKDINNTENKANKLKKSILLKKFIERECARINNPELYGDLTSYAIDLLEKTESNQRRL